MLYNSNPKVNKFRYYLDFFMVAVYLALGLLFLFSDIGIDNFPAYRKEIGTIMVIYAIIRTVLRYRKIKHEDNGRE